jgi:hypothetical protein
MRKIRAGLVTEALSVLHAIGVTDSLIFAENMPRPVTSDNWVQLWFKPGDPKTATMGSGGMDLVEGLLLVNIHIPLDQGNSFGLSAYNEFRKALTGGKRIIFEGQECEIVNCGANLGRIVDTWYRADIAIQWRAYLTRGVA